MQEDKKILLTEEDKLSIALKRTHTERFQMLMKLIRISSMLKNAKIITSDK
jgi:hypothetical protein